MSISEEFSKLCETLTNVFELPVIDKRTNKKDYVVFHIECTEDSKLKATHEATTEEEAQSLFVAFCEVEIDEDFSLNENLSNLLEECNNKIMESDFFELSE